jgi:exportin-5
MFFDMLRNPSLVVSIPVLHCWTKLLRSRIVRESEVVNQMIGGLLETCCSRLIRYEALPEDSEDVTLLFLNEDIDTFPERHAFLGNYRRYCEDVVEVTVRRTPIEAMQHIFGQADTLFQNLYNGLPPFQGSPIVCPRLKTSILTSISPNLLQALHTGSPRRCTSNGDQCGSSGIPQMAFHPRV